MYVPVHPVYRPWLENIEEAEHQETRQQPVPAFGYQPEGYPHADHFVPDDALVVMHA
ncbi:hypothetical protein D3C72_2589140 [compost metagenome]